MTPAASMPPAGNGGCDLPPLAAGPRFFTCAGLGVEWKAAVRSLVLAKRRKCALTWVSAVVTTRACLLIADAVVDDDRGEGDAAKVGQGILVIAGGDPTPLLEPVEPAFDGVAVAVQPGVEGRWSPSG